MIIRFVYMRIMEKDGVLFNKLMQNIMDVDYVSPVRANLYFYLTVVRIYICMASILKTNFLRKLINFN